MVAAPIVTLSPFASADDIAISLRTAKSVYRTGQRVTFEITYRNISSHPLRFLAEPEMNFPDTLRLVRVDDNRPAEHLEFVERSMLWGNIADKAVILAPNESHVRRIRAEFSGELPAWFREVLPSSWQANLGPYLSFRGASAFRLPGFGRYKVFANYRFSPQHPSAPYLKKQPRVFFGEVESTPIVVNFER